ncbi:MAG TPA: RNA-binding protein [Aliidongia sp.]|uniref:RNA-binding protein n=1 Tax=Aliidongia sp. TaxID=1914230 RepID=UPI002DDD0449|nr:RNA-binding protein [Aliidongia sp.]HEV2673957.1 RNA-binding protein [Aliidongia sp.]
MDETGSIPDDAPDGMPPDEPESGPLRRCIVTGERLAKETMVRCVVGPDAVIVPDVGAALPGRGLWLTSRRDIVATAVKKRAFDRAARRSVTIPADLADRIELLLVRRCREAVGLARRSGKAVAGFEKVGQAIRKGGVGLLVAASDGADGGRHKVAAMAPGLPVMDQLNAAELGAAFGREHVVHGAIGAGALAARLRVDAARLAGFRAPNGPAPTDEGPHRA